MLRKMPSSPFQFQIQYHVRNQCCALRVSHCFPSRILDQLRLWTTRKGSRRSCSLQELWNVVVLQHAGAQNTCRFGCIKISYCLNDKMICIKFMFTSIRFTHFWTFCDDNDNDKMKLKPLDCRFGQSLGGGCEEQIDQFIVSHWRVSSYFGRRAEKNNLAINLWWLRR